MNLLKPAVRRPQLLPWRNGDPFEPFFRRFIDLWAGPETAPEAVLGWLPSVEIVDGDDEVVLTAEVPGVKRDDLEVEITDDVLTLKGTKRADVEREGGRHYVRERSYGIFERSFTLPRSVDTNAIRAEFSDGVLTIRMPKTQDARGRRIEVTTAAR